jgi:hypothetical protein
MARGKQFSRQPEDPQGRALDDLDERPASADRPSRSGRAPARPHEDFPPCPAERSENTWRLVRLFAETGKANGRLRVVSPWQLAEDLAFKINHDDTILAFIKDHPDLVEDILGRMIKLYWQHYVTDGMSRRAIVDQYLDDYWEDLWDQAKTQYATDEIQRLDAAGQLKVVPKVHRQSLMNDVGYQAALQDLRTEERLRAELSNRKHQLESGTDEPQS